jgi:hypothetical protein
VLAREFVEDAVLLGELLGRAVEEIGLARLAVAAGGDEPEALVLRRGAEAEVSAGQFLLEQLVVGLEGFVAPVNARALVLVGGADEFVREVGEDGGAEVHAVQGV